MEFYSTYLYFDMSFSSVSASHHVYKTCGVKIKGCLSQDILSQNKIHTNKTQQVKNLYRLSKHVIGQH